MAIYTYFKNNFISSLLIIIVVLSILYLLIKFGLPTKTKKKEKETKKQVEKVAQKETEAFSVSQKEKETIETRPSEVVAIKDEDAKQASSVEEKNDNFDAKEKEFNEKYQFEEGVKSGVSRIKLKKNLTVRNDANSNQIENINESSISKEQVSKDHRMRLSEAIQNNDFSKMFASHLSDKYNNVNADSHLRERNDLFQRTNAMMDNTMRRFGDNLFLDVSDAENERRENFVQSVLDEIDDDVYDEGYVDNTSYIDVKSMIMSEMILNRKKSQK